MGFLRGVVNVLNVLSQRVCGGFGISQFSPLLFCSSLKVSVKKPLLGFPLNYPRTLLGGSIPVDVCG